MTQPSFRWCSSFSVPTLQPKLGPQTSFVALGSCFGEHIGNRLHRHGFNGISNPGGALYNPLSMAAFLERCLKATPIHEHELLDVGERWVHPLLGSAHGHANLQLAAQTIDELFCRTRAQLQRAQLLILTWGTALYYVDTARQHIVGNCHRRPASTFERKVCEPSEIVARLHPLLRTIREASPDLRILMTVSPVRHFKDGAIVNQRSKARLLLAAEQLEAEYSEVHYFPAYELVMDELREYRFFESDLMHPNAIAQEHVWSHFIQSSLDTVAAKKCSDFAAFLRDLEHDFRRSSSANAQRHLSRCRSQLDSLRAVYPSADFEFHTRLLEQREAQLGKLSDLDV